MLALTLIRAHVPPINEAMKNHDSDLNQEISWNEFEVVARNRSHALRFKNRALRNQVRDLKAQARRNSRVVESDTGQPLDYSYTNDDMALMDKYRVKRDNAKFEYTVENPSDEIGVGDAKNTVYGPRR